MSEEMKTRAKLLTCPFCGGEPDYCETSAWWVRCGECGADAQCGSTREEAAQLWNRRAALSRLDAGEVCVPAQRSTIGFYPDSIIAIRDALVKGDTAEAYHALYEAVDPLFIKLEPWAEIEAAASHPSDNLQSGE